MTINKKVNPVVADILYHTLENLANNPSFEISVGLIPGSEIGDLAIKNGRSVFNKFEKRYLFQPQAGYPFFEEYLMDVAKKGTPITLDPTNGIVQAEIKKKALRGQEFPLTDGLWYQVQGGELSLYRNKDKIAYDSL